VLGTSGSLRKHGASIIKKQIQDLGLPESFVLTRKFSMFICRPDCPSTPSSQSSAAVESGSGSSQDEQQEALCSVEVGELPQQMSYIPVFGLRSLQQQQQRQHGKAAKHDSEAVSSVGSGNSSVAVNSGKDRDAVQSTPGDGDQLGISDLHQHSLQLALEHSSADWLKQPPETFVPWLGAPPAWLCGQDSSSVDPWSTSRLSELPEPLPTHVPKLCVTVSRVSSELDSLAIPVLKTLAPVSRGDASSPGLSGSRHLGEF
jgi:hypothetical protein